ncbi:hypothetical protein SCP_0101430 [Sparassis crispa]|uniref:Uncharacterized protein n=1 Tax=Sparassis crispa TaxID=139825 RepID=A0A401G539_9APHY|nr:hypothetical protein SCP_0101430 [Sparassis crispa]GBE77270.1 hypothetical protein SCP_0101430 [Sparassis crispa]
MAVCLEPVRDSERARAEVIPPFSHWCSIPGRRPRLPHGPTHRGGETHGLSLRRSPPPLEDCNQLTLTVLRALTAHTRSETPHSRLHNNPGCRTRVRARFVAFVDASPSRELERSEAKRRGVIPPTRPNAREAAKDFAPSLPACSFILPAPARAQASAPYRAAPPLPLVPRDTMLESERNTRRRCALRFCLYPGPSMILRPLRRARYILGLALPSKAPPGRAEIPVFELRARAENASCVRVSVRRRRSFGWPDEGRRAQGGCSLDPLCPWDHYDNNEFIERKEGREGREGR